MRKAMLIAPCDKILIYTAIIGDCDEYTSDHKCLDNNTDLMLFTDNYDFKNPSVNIKYVTKPDIIDSSRYSRYFKILPHRVLEGYKYHLWIDGHVQIIGSIRDMLNSCLNPDNFTGLAFMDHPDRDCIYDEALVCSELKKDYPRVISGQMSRYASEGFPEHHGLIRGGVIFRESNRPAINVLMEHWFNELLQGSRRDQLSFNYSTWKTGIKYNRLPRYFYKTYFAQVRHHNSTI